VGTSYQTLLVIAEPATLRSAAHELGVDGWLVSTGPQRSAILPREGDGDYVDVRRLAKLLSSKVGPALSNEVVDSDAVVMAAYRDGRLVHEYVSDQAMLVDWFIDDDGRSRFRIGDREYPADSPTPRGPAGADPGALAPYGIAPVDLDRLGAALRGEFAGAGPVFAEFQHRLILKALNLDPRPLTTAFRWADPAELPGAVRITQAAPAAVTRPGADWVTIDLVLITGLPRDADPVEAGQLVADAVTDTSWPVRAQVACTGVLPGAAGGPEIVRTTMRLRPVPRTATYFVRLRIRTGPDRPCHDSVLAEAQQAWEGALRGRYGRPARQSPQILYLRPEQFELGFNAAVQYVSSRPVS
jgi:hypothetical protein